MFAVLRSHRALSTFKSSGILSIPFPIVLSPARQFNRLKETLSRLKLTMKQTSVGLIYFRTRLGCNQREYECAQLSIIAGQSAGRGQRTCNRRVNSLRARNDTMPATCHQNYSLNQSICSASRDDRSISRTFHELHRRMKTMKLDSLGSRCNPRNG